MGLQFGDEGKGKVVDFLSGFHGIVVKYNGGRNAGHTVVTDAGTFKFHLIPSGSLRAREIVLANGMTIDPFYLVEEIRNARAANPDIKVLVSRMAHVVTELHMYLDTKEEEARGALKIGTTAMGIGPAYEDKYGRTGIRMGDLASPEVLKAKLSLMTRMKASLLKGSKYEKPEELDRIVAELAGAGREISGYMCDTEVYLDGCHGRKADILFEGSHGTLLDVDFGMYPYVTSSNTLAGAVSVGSGFSFRRVHNVIGVVKTYMSRVGEGPFPTEISGNEADRLREMGHEYGTTTGRPRRVGWLDLQLLKYSIMINDVDSLALTSLDTLGKMSEVRVGTGYRKDGKEITGIIRSMKELEGLEVKYRSFQPWGELSDGQVEDMMRRGKEAMPDSLKEFITFVEDSTGKPAEFISLGKKREMTLVSGVFAGRVK